MDGVTVENWKPITGFPRYQVSDLGRIRRGSKIMLQSIKKKSGYPRIFLHQDGRYCFTVHRLVTDAFLGPCPEGYEVDHCDGIKTNNRLDNLEYVTRSENIRRSYKLGLHNTSGEKSNNTNLTNAEVLEIKELLREVREGKASMTQTDIGQHFGVSRYIVSRINTGHCWGNLQATA